MKLLCVFVLAAVLHYGCEQDRGSQMVFLNISTTVSNNQKFSVTLKYNTKDSVIYYFNGTGRCRDSLMLKFDSPDLSVELKEFGLTQRMWIPRSYKTATVDVYFNSYYFNSDSSVSNDLSVYQYDHDELLLE